MPFSRFFRIRRSEEKNPTLHWFIWSGVMSATAASLFGPFTVKFLERIGGTEFHISLLNSLPGIVGVAVSLPGALWLAGHKGKGLKTLTVEFTLASRLLVSSLIPLVWLSPALAPICCVLLLALKNIPESISLTAFQGLTGDLFALEERSTAITQRSRYSVPATLAVSLAAGLILRELPGSDAQRLTFYQLFFILSALFGIMEAVFIQRMRSAGPRLAESHPPWRDVVRKVVRNRRFMLYACSSLVFYFSWQMGWPLFSIYQVIHLGADELWLSVIGVMSSAGMFMGYRFWNRIILSHGNNRAAVYATLGMSLNPMMMAAFPNLYWVSGVSLLIGFFTAGCTTVLLNALLEVAPQEYRVVYVGAYNTLVNASLSVSPIVAFLVLRWIGIVPALAVVCACRLAGCFALWLYSRRVGRSPSIEAGAAGLEE
jgi:hypothetical protein